MIATSLEPVAAPTGRPGDVATLSHSTVITVSSTPAISSNAFVTDVADMLLNLPEICLSSLQGNGAGLFRGWPAVSVEEQCGKFSEDKPRLGDKVLLL